MIVIIIPHAFEYEIRVSLSVIEEALEGPQGKNSITVKILNLV